MLFEKERWNVSLVGCFGLFCVLFLVRFLVMFFVVGGFWIRGLQPTSVSILPKNGLKGKWLIIVEYYG